MRPTIAAALLILLAAAWPAAQPRAAAENPPGRLPLPRPAAQPRAAAEESPGRLPLPRPAASLGQASDPDLVRRVREFAEGMRDKMLPGGSLTRAPLKLPGGAVSFLMQVEPSVAGKSRREILLQRRIDWPATRDPAVFAEWAGNFLVPHQRTFVTFFPEEEDAEHFVADWLGGVSRNKTGMKVWRNGGTVIWGAGNVLDRR